MRLVLLWKRAGVGAVVVLRKYAGIEVTSDDIQKKLLRRHLTLLRRHLAKKQAYFYGGSF